VSRWTTPAGSCWPAPQSFQVVFDPQTSEILEWSMQPPAGDAHRCSPSRTVTVLDTGYARQAGDRP
jgi:hypothetical protein